MSRDRIPKAVRTVRKDLSDWVWHLVRRDGDPKQTIRRIIEDQKVLGSQDPVTKETVVCLSDAPLRELVNQDPMLFHNNYSRLSLYGIGFRKTWIYEEGGLPVIYQPNDRLDSMSREDIWRHVEFDLSKPVDYSWQREWRIETQELKFELSDVVVLLEDIDGLEDMLWMIHIDVDAKHGDIMYDSTVLKEFDFIPLEHVEIDDDRSIEVCRTENYDDILTEDQYENLRYLDP